MRLTGDVLIDRSPNRPKKSHWQPFHATERRSRKQAKDFATDTAVIHRYWMVGPEIVSQEDFVSGGLRVGIQR